MSGFDTKQMVRGRKVGGAIVALTLAALGVFIAAAPASAATSDCQDGRTCVWKDAGFATGGWGNIQYSYENGIADFRDYEWGLGQWGSLNDNVTSVYNNGNQQRSYLRYDLNFTGIVAADLGVKQAISNLGAHNDQATSGGFKWCVDNPSNYVCQ